MIKRILDVSNRVWPLVLAIGLIWTIFFGLLIYRAFQVASTDEKLCGVIRSLVKGGGEPGMMGTAGFDYYRTHPEELKIARRNYNNTLKQLNCHDLPTAGGTP